MRKQQRKRANGGKRFEARLKPVIEEARKRIVKHARRYGSVTSAQAAEILGTEQSYYHLKCLAEEGLLKHAGWNLWRAIGRGRGA